MTKGRHAKSSKVNQKLGAAVVAGVAGLGTMFSMVPASFADTLPANNESQNTASSALNKKSPQYGAKLKSSAGNHEEANILAADTETDGSNAVDYDEAAAASTSDLASADNAFASAAANATAAAKSASESLSLIQQQADSQAADVQRDIKALYNGSNSSATGALVTDAQNFDSWAHDWIAAANNGSAGYANYLEQLEGVISDIPMWENHGTLIVNNSQDVETILNNLKIMKASVEALQNLMENCNTASMAPDQAFATAQEDALLRNSKFRELQKFIQQSAPITHDGGSGSVPGGVSGYGGTEYKAWPDGNPFGGYNSSYIWQLLGDIQSTFLGKLPEYENPPAGWAQDYANYKYLQAVEPYAEQISQDASQALTKVQGAAAKIASAKELANQNTGDKASDSAAAAEAKQDVQEALQDMGQAKSLEAEMTAAMNEALTQYSNSTGASPKVTINGSAVDLPTAANENPLYSQSDISAMQSILNEDMSQVNQLLSGSPSGDGTDGLLGGATAWQKAISAQKGLEDAQNKALSRNAQKVQKDVSGVKSEEGLAEPVDEIHSVQKAFAAIPSFSGAEIHIQSAKPASDLATTGSDIAAATIAAAVLLAAGVAAELLKKKGAKKEK